MKILKISFQNINSLKGTHEIDFTEAPFTASSLFAITGPTGSGKSTLLDVISLALFNQVPRLGRISKNEVLSKGAILTRNQKEAIAKVSYSCKKGVYESLWRISTNRNGNLRNHEMELFDVTTGMALDLKNSEVPSKNEELIGLNYNQFIKSVLLAQGEFAQFLRARKDERGELLEKITGTGIYRQLGQRSYEKFREVNQDIYLQQQKMDLISSKLLPEEARKELTSSLGEKEKALQLLEEVLGSLKKELELKEDLQKRGQQIKLLQQKKEQAEKSLREFETAHGKPLKAHESVRHCSEALRAWKQVQRELESLHEELNKKQEEETRNLKAIQDCLKTTGTFTGTGITAENITGELERFAQEVSRLLDTRREKLSRYQHLQQQLETTLSEVSFTLDSKAPEESLRTLKALKKTSAERMQAFREELAPLDLENLEQERLELRRKLQKGREAQRKHQEILNLGQELEKTLKEETALQSEMASIPGTIEKAQLKTEVLSSKLQALQGEKEIQLLRASLEEHRAKLKSGEPCSLCGSLEHPYAEHLPETQDSLDQQITQKEQELSQQKELLSSLRTTLRHHEARLKALHQDKTDKQERLSTAQKTFNEQYQHLQQEEQLSDWEQWCRKLEVQEGQLEKVEKEKRYFKQVAGAIPLHEELNEVLQQGKELKRDLDALYTGKNIHQDCRKIQDHWIGISREKTALKKQLQELKEKISAKQELLLSQEEELLDQLPQEGFSGIEEAFGALLPDVEAHKLHSQRQEIKEEIAAHSQSLEVLGSQLQELLEKDRGKEKEAIQQDLQEKQAAFKELQAVCEDLRRRLRNDLEQQEELRALKAETAEKEKGIKRWRLLNELIGDARGKKFNDFAQDMSLSQLLKLANRRLQSLNDRYILDKPKEGEDDGLIAIDEHMGGQRRSVKTLSGGETFILSLAMALALSDMASRNVEIDSLFIDEGFGTLDPEMLDQTLDTLEKLQAESSKTIGIISHVDSLKERIGTQVRLERNGQGYSQLEVKG